jgi:hypothetical protein
MPLAISSGVPMRPIGRRSMTWRRAASMSLVPRLRARVTSTWSPISVSPADDAIVPLNHSCLGAVSPRLLMARCRSRHRGQPRSRNDRTILKVSPPIAGLTRGG